MGVAAVAVAASSGCGRRGADLFEPDWTALAAEEARRDRPEDAAVDPRIESTPPITRPDLEDDGTGRLELSIEQAVLLSLERNRDLAVARLAPVIAGAFEDIERGRFEPELFGDASFTREESLETARSTGEQFSVSGDDAALSGGVRQELPSGTTIELGVEQDRTISDRVPEQQAARVGLTVTQALLRGARPAVALASVRQAELDTQASRQELRGFTEALLADTEIAYWQYQLARRTIEIVERSLEVARQQSDQIMQRIDVGVLPRTEAAAVRSEVARREQALIDARSDLRAARLRLRRLMNLELEPANPAAELIATTEATIPTADLDDPAPRTQLARRLRPDLAEARLRLEQDRLETVRTRNGVLPRLDLFIALGKTGFSDTFAGSFEELDGSTYDVTLGLSFSQSLGRSAADGRLAAAIATRREGALAVANLEQLIELDVRLALNEARRTREQITATATTRELQEETARAELERFEVGAGTSLLVAQAQRDLLESRIAEASAVIDHRVALIRLELAEGSMLERRGIRVGD
jgi:outer membrane protein TolC